MAAGKRFTVGLLISTVIAAAVLLGCASTGRSAELRVVGCDLLGIEFTKALYGFSSRQPIGLSVALDGSRAGLDEIRENKADVALLALPTGNELDRSIYDEIVLGWFPVLVVVPAVTPIEQVSFGQLAAVFGANAPLSVHRWGDLGLAGEWASRPISAHVSAAGYGLTAELFRDVVLQGHALSSRIVRFRAGLEAVLQLSGESRGIGLVAVIPPAVTQLKRVAVTRRVGAPAFLPTIENLRTGDYPLALPLRVVFRRDAMGRIRPLLVFLLGDAVAALLEHAETVPEESSVRLAQARRLEKR